MQVQTDDTLGYFRDRLMYPKTTSVCLRIMLNTSNVKDVLALAKFGNEGYFVIIKRAVVAEVARINL
jgi:hypothetical protein